MIESTRTIFCHSTVALVNRGASCEAQSPRVAADEKRSYVVSERGSRVFATCNRKQRLEVSLRCSYSEREI